MVSPGGWDSHHGPFGCLVIWEFPAAVAPLLQVRAFGAEGSVIAVTWVDPGLAGELAEDLLGDVAERLAKRAGSF